MAKRYRKFKRISMTKPTAEFIVKLLVDRTFNDHYTRCDGSVNYALTGECHHETNGSLAVARMIEANITISSSRAHLDLPDEPELMKTLAIRLRDFSNFQDKKMKNAKRAFLRIADQVDAWSTRGPLHKLAEAGLELD